MTFEQIAKGLRGEKYSDSSHIEWFKQDLVCAFGAAGATYAQSVAAMELSLEEGGSEGWWGVLKYAEKISVVLSAS